jgi:hypothetical protein
MMTALRFNENINQRNLEGLINLMAEEHTFIDNSGVFDHDMKKGWETFFDKYPDYRNVFTSVTVQDNIVIMIGYSTCSDESRLNGPSMWTAKVENELVSEWRVYWLDQR